MKVIQEITELIMVTDPQSVCHTQVLSIAKAQLSWISLYDVIIQVPVNPHENVTASTTK